MNNITPIKTSAMVALLMMAGQFMVSCVNAAEKEVTGMHHQQPASETLSERQQAIPLIAAAMASSQMGKLNAALNQGLDAGLTINETKEILIQLYAYTGFPRSLNALNELMKVVEVRKQQGLHDAVGKAPQRQSPVGDELRRMGAENQALLSGGPVKGAVFDFAPEINQFLQTHLFGDIFSRESAATRGTLDAKPWYSAGGLGAFCGREERVVPASGVNGYR